MKRNHFLSLIPIFFAILFLFTACIPERFAWSPDGKHLAFIGPNDQGLWLWDFETKTAENLLKQETVACRYMPNSNTLVFGTKSENQNDTMDLRLINREKNEWLEIEKDVGMFFAIDADGVIYYLHDEALCLYDYASNQKKSLFPAEADYIDIDPSGKRMILSKNSDSFAIYKKDGDTFEIMQTVDLEYLWPQWIDDKHILALSSSSKSDDTGQLTIVTLPLETEPKEIASNISAMDIPSLTPDRRAAIVTEKVGQLYQLISIDLQTGKKTRLTHEPAGASFGQPSPDGKQLAYFHPAESDEKDLTARILDLESNQVHVLWRDEEERLMSVANVLSDNGRLQLAEETYNELLYKFPASRFGYLIAFQKMLLHLAQPAPDTDRAFQAFQHSGDYQDRAYPYIWHAQYHAASDPAEDWLTQFGTPASQETYKYDTDKPRDLLGLWARWSDEHLYLKIDYNSPHDLDGLLLKDTYILLDFASPNNGYRHIAGQTEWEFGAERTLILRHWQPNGKDSQYDAEILNEKGEPVLRFLSAGFELSNSAPLQVLGTIHNTGGEGALPVKYNLLGWEKGSGINMKAISPGEDTGSLVLAVSRDILGLNEDRPVRIQVCTAKGGIESYEKKEKSVRDLKPEQTMVTDAFGKANTTARMQQDYNHAQKKIIKGYAAILNLHNNTP
ncbi:hypothetical protein GF373_05405 [bacterium]|nr:hypothetical protein [bacterium]